MLEKVTIMSISDRTQENDPMCAIFVALDLLKKEIYEDTTKFIQMKNPTNVLSVHINAGDATLSMVTCEFIQVPRLTFTYNFMDDIYGGYILWRDYKFRVL